MQHKLPPKCLTGNIRQSKTLADLSFWYLLVCERCPQVCAHFNQVVLNQLAGRKKHRARLPLLLWEDVRLLWCEACSCSQHKSLTYLIRASVILRGCDKIINQEQSWLSRKHHHTLPFKMLLVEGSKRDRKDNTWLKLKLHFRKRMVCWNNNNKKQIQNTAYQLPASFGCSPRFHYVSPAPAQIPSLVSLRSFFKAQIGLCVFQSECGQTARQKRELRPEKSCHQNRKKPKQTWQRHRG